MNLEEQMLLLERTLSTLSGYKGWVIGKCSFFLEKEPYPEEEQTCSLQVIRENSCLVDIGISQGKTERLRVTLMRPAKNSAGTSKDTDQSSGKNAGAPEEKAGKTDQDRNQAEKFLVTRGETDRYLTVSGDKNPIHQGENAIVPGFLMVNRIAGMLKNPEKLQVRFFTPLPVGESAKLVIQGENGDEQTAELYRNGERILKIKAD